MVTRTELTKIKKQATMIAQAKGESIDELTANFLQKYIQDNFEWVLESLAKQKAQKATPTTNQADVNQQSATHTYKGEQQ